MAPAAEAPTSQPQTYTSDSRTTSKFIPHDFVPNGTVDKPVWRSAHWTQFDRDAFKAVSFPQSATEVASLWTPEYVYFAFRCRYSLLNVFENKDPNSDFWALWERDVVEVFLNPQPERMRHYYEFEVAPNNLWIDLEINLDKQPATNAKWDSEFQHATSLDQQNHLWNCELRIPVAALNGAKPLTADTEWRINFFRCDGPSENSHRRLLSWSMVQSATNSFHSPWSFGVIRFAK